MMTVAKLSQSVAPKFCSGLKCRPVMISVITRIISREQIRSRRSRPMLPPDMRLSNQYCRRSFKVNFLFIVPPEA